MATWRRLSCKVSELKLDITLACGQSFRWKETEPGQWTSVLYGRVWTLMQNEDEVLYKVFENNKQIKEDPEQLTAISGNNWKEVHDDTEEKEAVKLHKIKEEIPSIPLKDNKTHSAPSISGGLYESILRDYFQLDINLEQLYSQWCKADPNFKEVASVFSGIRMLRQDPVENLFSFICSSNNHISRISGMVDRLCERYGNKIMDLDGQSFHSFPTVEALVGKNVEQTLRELGFGYRAKYINESAKYILKNHDTQWLYSLRTKTYEEAHSELIKLHGVGAKVADCVCLMSLDKPGAIPVDTHVWQIAARDYLPKLRSAKSLTDTLYKDIGDCFRDIWGEYAGWAHSVLFSADLRKFKDKKQEAQTANNKKRQQTAQTEKVNKRKKKR